MMQLREAGGLGLAGPLPTWLGTNSNEKKEDQVTLMSNPILASESAAIGRGQGRDGAAAARADRFGTRSPPLMQHGDVPTLPPPWPSRAVEYGLYTRESAPRTRGAIGFTIKNKKKAPAARRGAARPPSG